jgi:hypothetical protein
MLSNLPFFAHRTALNKLTAALERGEFRTGAYNNNTDAAPPSAAEAAALSDYRGSFLGSGFGLSALLGIAAFVKLEPRWILHKPRQWTKVGQLSAVRNTVVFTMFFLFFLFCLGLCSTPIHCSPVPLCAM